MIKGYYVFLCLVILFCSVPLFCTYLELSYSFVADSKVAFACILVLWIKYSSCRIVECIIALAVCPNNCVQVCTIVVNVVLELWFLCLRLVGPDSLCISNDVVAPNNLRTAVTNIEEALLVVCCTINCTMIDSEYSLLGNLTIVVADEVTTCTYIIECTVLEVQGAHITLT